jgi:hypothetical protein
MAHKVTVLNPIKRQNWLFRVSTFEDHENGIHTLLIILWNTKHRDLVYFRFFDDEGRAAAFVDECAAGKYGDTLDDIKD